VSYRKRHKRDCRGKIEDRSKISGCKGNYTHTKYLKKKALRATEFAWGEQNRKASSTVYTKEKWQENKKTAEESMQPSTV
jgi:hypothetical protein